MRGEDTAIGIKSISVNEPWAMGHFGRYPIFPGVLIVEAIAQAAVVMVAVHRSKIGKPLNFETQLPRFMSIEKAKFRAPVRPGDRLAMHLAKLKESRGAYKFEGRCFVGETLVAEAIVMAMAVGDDDA